MSKTVLVVGDLVRCHHLAPEPGVHHPARTQVHLEPGGAFYLETLLRAALQDTRVQGPTDAGLTGADAAAAFFQWEPFSSPGSERKTWRVRSAAVQSGQLPLPQRHPDLAEPDLVVVDDGNLGFRDEPEAWPLALRGGNPGHILLKTTRPVAEGALWQHLRKNGLLDKVTVVISAENIRARGGSLSRALSWDAAIEDVIYEMGEEYSSRDLAKCARTIIYFGTGGVAWFDRAEWQRLAFDPAHLEGTWEESRPGRLIGAASTISAAAALHQLAPERSSLFGIMTRAMAGLREAHQSGAGSYPGLLRIDTHIEIIQKRFAGVRPDGQWASAFRPGAMGTLMPAWLEQGESDLLSAACGPDSQYMAAKAMDVVLRGLEVALPQVPRVNYGAYITVDREEIEGINGIRALIQNYRHNPRDTRPLSLAVFGPPGSGKSFAIKQLSAALQPKDQPYEFNLSQFRDESALEEAFHHVRDASVGNRIPIVFWDEFDTEDLRWLKSFLAPMQDSQFHARGSIYPLGKAIFVFAGGTSFDFKSFDHSDPDHPGNKQFRARKGNDFVSRLRGYLNIKGPNPTCEKDGAHLLRRATLLRSSLKRFHPQLIDPGTGKAQISESVARAFLRVKRYTHGARSLETLVAMSREVTDRRLAAPDLPEKRVLDVHVSDDFLDLVAEAEIQMPAVERFAIASHDNWCRTRLSQDWTHGEPRDNGAKRHPLLKPYAELDAGDKARALANNWLSASLLEAKLHRAGFGISRKDESAAPVNLTPGEIEKLAELEHDIWLRDHLLRGFEQGERADEERLIHAGLTAYAGAADADRSINRELARNIETILDESGYQLRRKS